MAILHFNINSDYEKIYDLIFRQLPCSDYLNIVIKPNWVLHQDNSNFPIEAIVTSSNLIDLIIQACLKKYESLRKITVCDVPLQTCEWDILVSQAGIDKLKEKYESYMVPQIRFLDLRKERWRVKGGHIEFDGHFNGDPLGYVEVVVDKHSLLEEVSENSNIFRVSDYDPKEIISVHKKGYHRYLISKTILKADLIINVPKMKTHQKAGITGALKNLVGINGSKAYLVHHRKGFPSHGGDEFPPNVSFSIYLQARFRELLQKKSKTLFRISKLIWEFLKKIEQIETIGTKENLKRKFYVGSGSWFGNDSIWRMVYDLNNIILFAHKKGGVITCEKQRDYICILDGIISGEGNGPLQPIPVETNLIAISTNPFLIDFAMAKMMGFDYKKIPLLKNHGLFLYKVWSDFNPNKFNINFNTESFTNGINSIPILKYFIPPPGWKGHIELASGHKP